ncbi:PAX-interacting protein 1 [Chelonia mydas]|uniref:PAX-interacting protein 1 n=1 Tax=Chelonia mydas TaxID=8469 RepID=M7BZL0_CHEMY|nr:PAX-interacting protein 1 [Chelonia mydas]
MEKYECACKRESIKIVTPDWVLDSISDKAKKEEISYHPRLIIYEEEEEEEEEDAENEEQDSQNEASTDEKLSSPASSREGSPLGDQAFSPKSVSADKTKGELMFDDSSDSSPEKQERNLNWTPAEVPQTAAAKRRLPQGKDSGLINLCANVPPVPGNILPPEIRGNIMASVQGTQGSERPEMMTTWSPAVRTLRNITNSADIQQINRPSNVAHATSSATTSPSSATAAIPTAACLATAVASVTATAVAAAAVTANTAAEHSTATTAAATAADSATAVAAAAFTAITSATSTAATANSSAATFDSNISATPTSVPEEYFLLGCVFAIADYPEQMSDKQLLATWKRIIQAHGGTVDPTLTSRCTHLLCESQVSNMYVQAQFNSVYLPNKHHINAKMIIPSRIIASFIWRSNLEKIISVTGFVDSDRDDLKLMAYLAGAKYTGYLCRSNTVLICKEPTGLKYEKAKEWRIPCVNAQWLCDILLGNFEALRQIQHSRYTVFNLQDPLSPTQHLILNLLDAWRVPLKVSSELLMGVRLPLKPKQNESSLQPSSKRARIEDIPPPTKKLSPELTPMVLFTGFEPTQVQQYIKKLYILGGEVAESAQKCTHLVASKVTRTVKFLTAISVVKHIVTPEWLEECFKCQKFVDEQNFMLRDAEAEVLFCFSLEESLKRAQVAPLFKGKYFYITPGICPSLSTMKAIVECAGGKVLSKQPSFRKLMEHKQNKSLSAIILISCENDLHLCREYFARGIGTCELLIEFQIINLLTVFIFHCLSTCTYYWEQS